MKLLRSALLGTAALTALAAPARAQAPASPDSARRPEVLVLGVYHMANPGRDVYNVEADDVLAPKRQREIAELVAVLKRFQPTKIAVEASPRSDLAKRYADYVAGTRPLSRNEVEQIGFRLAKELGHLAVHPADADGEFPLPRVLKYAKATGQGGRLDSQMTQVGEWVKATDEYLKTHTVLQTLRYLNSDANVAREVGWHYLIARYGEPYDYAGPDLLAEWYRRNLRIYNEVAKLVAAPHDRVLVIFGSGHLGWLRQIFAADPTVRLRKLDEFAP